MPAITNTNQWLTKVNHDDVPLLHVIAAAPRLSSVVSRAWRLSKPHRPTIVARDRPSGAAGSSWQPGILLGQGLKLGGARALAGSGRNVFKGQNIFASGVRGEPMGRWDGSLERLSAPKVYLYESLFQPDRLFAGREIAQLPTVCRVPPGVVFQNSAIVMHLEVDLPLHTWVLARPVQWFAAKTLRASVIEDLASTWMNREYIRLPVPVQAGADEFAELTRLGDELAESDDTLADSRRQVRALIQASTTTPLMNMVMARHPAVEGFEREGVTSDAMDLTGVREEGTRILGDDPALRLVVPDENLRCFLLYALEELAEDESSKELPSDKLTTFAIPNDLARIAQAILEYRSVDPKEEFERAHVRLDIVAGTVLGLSTTQTSQIISQMREDPFLKELQPAYAHRGLRVQPYSDRSGRDQYA